MTLLPQEEQEDPRMMQPAAEESVFAGNIGNGEENVVFASDLSEALRMLDDMMGPEDETEDDGDYHEDQAFLQEEDTPQEVDGAPPLSFLRGSNDPYSGRSLQMLKEGTDHDGKWDCANLDIVDACRGTSVSKTYRGNFKLFDGKCKGDFVDGLPIYVSSNKPNRPLYIYALGVYDETWSVAALRGLTRWRIVSFQNFDDKTSCRVESANIFQIEFAAEGQPYNYYPTIYCFDEKGNDFSGFKSSTINIRCNDKAETIGGVHSTSSNGTTIGIAIGAIVGLVVLAIVGFFLWKRCKNNGGTLCSCPARRKKTFDDDDYDSRYPQSRADDSRFTTGSRFTRNSLFSRDTRSRDESRFTRSRDSGSRDSRFVDEEYADDVEPLSTNKNDSNTTGTSEDAPSTVFVPTIEEPSETSYVDEVIEDPIAELKNTSASSGTGPGKLKIPNMFSKFAPKQEETREITSPPSPTPKQIEPLSDIDSPGRPSVKSEPIPAPSGHYSNTRAAVPISPTRSMPPKEPSRSAISRDITDIADKIDQELDSAISSTDDEGRGGGRRFRGYGSGASTDDERSDYKDRRRDVPAKRRPSGGFGSSGHKRRPSGGFGFSGHNRSRSADAERRHNNRDAPAKRRPSGGFGFGSSSHGEEPKRRPSGGFGSSGHNRSRSADAGRRKKDPFMDLSRRSRFKAIQRNFSDKTKALGDKSREFGKNMAEQSRELSRNLHDRAKRSRSEERGRQGSSRSLLRSGSQRSLMSNSSERSRQDRSRSMERWANANKSQGRSRSQSKERSSHGDRRGRSQSRERSNHGTGRGSRALSQERSRAAEIFANRNRNRSQSRDRSGSRGYDDRDRNRNRSRSRSRSAQRSNTFGGKSSSEHTSRPRTNRDRMSASDHTKPNSDGWATAGDQARKRRERGSSPERSRHDYKDRSPSPYKERNRSLSKERAGAEAFANRKGRPSGPSSHQRPRFPSFSEALSNHKGRPSGPSSHQRPRFPSFSNPLAGSTGSAKGRGSLDASQQNRSVTKNEDGSIVVAVKRTREDGAIVTTKTKYATVALARRHGVEVD